MSTTPCMGPVCPVDCVVTPTWNCKPVRAVAGGLWLSAPTARAPQCNAECGKSGAQVGTTAAAAAAAAAADVADARATQDCYKSITTFPANGGADCPAVYMSQPCQVDSLVVDRSSRFVDARRVGVAPPQGPPCPAVPPPKVDCVVSKPTCTTCNAKCDENGVKQVLSAVARALAT